MTDRPAAMLARLKEAGLLSREAGEVPVERRGDRWLARLSDERLAWFPITSAAAAALRAEDRVLSLVSARCSFRVPRPLASDAGGWTVRTIVPGTVDPIGFVARLKSDPALVGRLARFLGGALAQQHTHIGEAEAAGWLPREPAWPMPRQEIRVKLPAVVDDAALIARADRALAAYDRDLPAGSENALVHADLGLHNLAVEPSTGEVNGIFDYGDAAWSDRHLDFRYLVFAAVPDALLDAAMAAYAEAGGAPLQRERVLLCNAAAAASHLAWRLGHAPDEVVAGRTLAQDLAWTGWALHRAGF